MKHYFSVYLGSIQKNSYPRGRVHMSADLHCHTVISDGTVTLEEIILLAKSKGLSYISITDHDTFAGVTRAKIFGKKNGVTVIEGAEISAYDYKRNRKVHILAYICEYPDRLMGMLKKIGDSRKRAMSISIQKVNRIYPIPTEMIVRRATGSSNIFKQHIMHALIDAGYTDTVFGDVFKKLFHPRTGLAKTNIEYPDVYEVIDSIHDAGGVAVLAHPGVYDSYELLEELAESGLDGVERYYPRSNPEYDEYLDNIIKKYDLIATGGTDFHGGNSTQTNVVGTVSVDDSVIEQLKERKKKYLIAEEAQ